jgi:glycerophosphoryl diester phosphodiesterase
VEALQLTGWGRRIAHRGANQLAPENTLEAFRKAHEGGAQAIELDVQRTRDGQLVVLHDDTLDRTTSRRGRVDAQTLADLQGAVPTLDEVLGWARGRVRVDIELKTSGYAGPVVECVRRHGLEREVMVTSFSREALDEVRQQAPELLTGQLLRSAPLKRFLAAGAALGTAVAGAGAFVLGVPVALAAGAGLVAGAWLGRRAYQNDVLQHEAGGPAPVVLPPWAGVSRHLVDGLKGAGHAVVPWTADPEPLVAYLLGAGADAVISNRV